MTEGNQPDAGTSQLSIVSRIMFDLRTTAFDEVTTDSPTPRYDVRLTTDEVS